MSIQFWSFIYPAWCFVGNFICHYIIHYFIKVCHFLPPTFYALLVSQVYFSIYFFFHIENALSSSMEMCL